MNLIERYVYAVGRYLPKDIREDVSRELRTNIEDMLPDNYSEGDVFKVLEELGSPMKLANEYNPNKRYLIGPGYYDNYLSILKLVVSICVAVSIGITLIDFIVSYTGTDIVNNIIELFTGIISGALMGVLQAAFWVTLIFVIFERSGVEAGYLSFKNQASWTPASLPEIPVDESGKISRGETILSMIMSIILPALLYFRPQLIAIYTFGDNDVLKITPLFNTDRLKIYMPFIFAFAVLQLGITIWKFIEGRWRLSMILIHIIFDILLCIMIVFMISDKALINPDLIPAIAELTKKTLETVDYWFNRGKWIFAALIIAINIWDALTDFYKYYVKK